MTIGKKMGTHSFFIDFDGDGRTDFLVFRSSDGYFAKWYSDAARGPDFVYTAPRYIGGSPGAFPGAQLVVGDFDGDGRTDVLVFRSSDGYFAKWYSDAARGPDFVYTAPRYIGGSPGAFPGAQLVVGDFDGDGRTDVLVFRSSDGYFAKWYSDAARGPDFVYTAPRYIGGSPGAFPGAQLVVGDFDGDGTTVLIVLRSSDGYFAKLYSDPALGPDFVYTAPRYIGGSPGAFPGAQLVVGDFDGDGSTDVLVFRPSDGYVGKWYRDAARGPDFIYQSAVYCGLFYADLRVGDFDGDGIDDVMLFRSGDGTFAKWYSDAARGPDFIRQQLRWIGGNPCVFPNAEILSAAEGSTYRAPHLIQPPP